MTVIARVRDFIRMCDGAGAAATREARHVSDT